MSASDRKWNRTKIYAALLSSALALGACSPDSNGEQEFFDGSLGPITTPDAAPPASDSGAVTPATDSGTNTQLDSSAPKPDGSVSPGVDASADSGTPTSDGGLDAGPTEDAAITSDTGTGDGATGDSSVGDSSTSDAGSDAGARPDQGKGNGSDVVLIGDSWMNNTLQILGTGGGISPALINVSGQRYRDYAKQGVELLAGNLFGSAIPTQWDAALRANKTIKTVVMTAGGNDVIQSASVQESCKTGGAECKMVLEKIGQALSQLWGKMAAAGVTDIVHIMYAKVAGDGVKEGEANAASLKMLCDNVPAPTRCHLFFTDAYVKTKSDLADGIHPKGAINTSIARGLVELMTKEGMRR